MKKKGCKKNEVLFKGRCYPKKMKQSEHVVLDWELEYGFRGNKIVLKNLDGCVINNNNVYGRCAYDAVKRNKESLAKTINRLLKTHKRKTEELKIPDKQWKAEYGYTPEGGHNKKKDFIETIKIGNAKYSAQYFFPLLNEILDESIVTKSKTISKKMIGEKIKITFWQDKKPDGPIIIESDTGVFVLAPRIEP